MKYKHRRKLQRELNKLVKEMNKIIADDNLWHGRFEFRQIAANYDRYEDGSGGVLLTKFRAIDKKTGNFCDYYINFRGKTFGAYQVARSMNDFIIEYCKVWETEGRESLYGDKIDYTKIVADYQRDVKTEWHRVRQVTI